MRIQLAVRFIGQQAGSNPGYGPAVAADPVIRAGTATHDEEIHRHGP
ncbi:hypothetical protein [Streptomyces sp. NPDC000618]